MRFQRVSYLTFWLGLPIALFAARGVHAQGVHVESTAYPTVTDERLQHPVAGAVRRSQLGKASTQHARLAHARHVWRRAQWVGLTKRLDTTRVETSLSVFLSQWNRVDSKGQGRR